MRFRVAVAVDAIGWLACAAYARVHVYGVPEAIDASPSPGDARLRVATCSTSLQDDAANELAEP